MIKTKDKTIKYGFLRINHIDSFDELKYTHNMSKRLQVVLSDNDYKVLARFSRKRSTTIAEVVREALAEKIKSGSLPDADARIAKILSYTKFSGPAVDIDDLLKIIESGKDQIL